MELISILETLNDCQPKRIKDGYTRIVHPLLRIPKKSQSSISPERPALTCACVQVFEGKQRLWEKEVDELKGLYAAKLRQLSQHAQRSQRSLQLQLYRAQQEKGRAQEELDSLRRVKGQEEEEEVGAVSPTLEETRWQVCGWGGAQSLLSIKGNKC